MTKESEFESFKPSGANKKAVYAGSFDPITNGHVWVIEQAARLFNEVVVAIAINPEKQGMFSNKERSLMIGKSVEHLSNVSVQVFSGEFLVSWATSIDASYIIRGIRNQNDFEYERMMRNINEDIAPHIQTIFLIPPRELAEISSSFVKGLVGLTDWKHLIGKYTSSFVVQKLNLALLAKQLRSRWVKMYGEGETEQAVYRELVERYTEPHRAYHNLQHIAECFVQLDKVDFVSNVCLRQVLESAIWFHGAIYDTEAKDNKAQSAELFERFSIECQLDECIIDFVADVKRVIMATTHLVVPQQLDEQIMVDIDLSILASSHTRFNEYESQILEEYARVPEDQFIVGRSKILQSFLEREVIFLTPTFKSLENIARTNINCSLAKLVHRS